MLDFDCWIVLATSVIAGTPAIKRGHDCGRREEEPFKCGKDVSGNSSPTRSPISPTVRAASIICQENCKRDESGKPEDHGDRFGREDSKFMSYGLEAHGSNDEVCDRE